jgi:alkylhydroperoxidase family enzyme
MATLPDPSDSLAGSDREQYDRMAAVRSHAEGRAHLGDVYVRMFNNPGVAASVGALGEHIRFSGTLPDEVRELVIVRYAARRRIGYEWSHHQRPARLAGVDEAVVDEVTAGGIPAALPDATRAALEAVDAVVAGRSIPSSVQERVVAGLGLAGVVEIVAVCGLYALMGYMVTAFDIAVEDGLPPAPF